MANDGFTRQHRAVGRVAAWIYIGMSVIYALTTILGLLTLESPDEPIGDPYFTIMESLIVLIAPALIVIMVVVHLYASKGAKAFSLAAPVAVLFFSRVFERARVSKGYLAR
jgi:hypothetical protein